MEHLRLFEDFYPGPPKAEDLTKRTPSDNQVLYLEEWINNAEIDGEKFADLYDQEKGDYMYITSITWFDFTDEHRWFIMMGNEAYLTKAYARQRAKQKQKPTHRKHKSSPDKFKPKFTEVVLWPSYSSGSDGDPLIGIDLSFATHGWPASRSKELWKYNYEI